MVKISAASLATSLTAALLQLATSVTGQTPLSDWASGIATFYGGAPDGMNPYSPSFGTLDGSCGYGVLSQTQYPFWSVGALSPLNPFYIAGPTDGCGACFEIQCMDAPGYSGLCSGDPTQTSVTIMISDSCPDCEANHIDLQALTFAKIAPMAVGRIAMQYRRVACQPPNPITVTIDQNSGSGGWFRILVEQAAGAGTIASVQFKGPNTPWTGMTNQYGAAWQSSFQPEPPIDLHITSSDGSEVTAFGVITQNGQIGNVETSVQFTLVGQASYQPNITLPSPAPNSSPLPESPSPSPSASPSPSNSSSPSNSTSPAPSSPSPSGGQCDDTPPGNNYTCQQQLGFGQCNQPWMTQTSASEPFGFCAKTCGRCTR